MTQRHQGDQDDHDDADHNQQLKNDFDGQATLLPARMQCTVTAILAGRIKTSP